MSSGNGTQDKVETAEPCARTSNLEVLSLSVMVRARSPSRAISSASASASSPHCGPSTPRVIIQVLCRASAKRSGPGCLGTPRAPCSTTSCAGRLSTRMHPLPARRTAARKPRVILKPHAGQAQSTWVLTFRDHAERPAPRRASQDGPAHACLKTNAARHTTALLPRTLGEPSLACK